MNYNQKGGNVVLNVFLYVFVAIGVIAVLYIVIISITRAVKNAKTEQKVADTYPPTVYMEESGFDCPDYWIKVKDSNGKSYCKNSYNLKLKDNCTDSENFPDINANSWEKASDKSQVPGVSERCKWLKKCGGVWQGIDNYC